MQYLNSLSSNDEQNAYLAGLMSLVPVQRRRNRQEEGNAMFHDNYFMYKVRNKGGDKAEEVNVCFKNFQSIHGISKGKVEYLQKNFKVTGTTGKDKHGEHSSSHGD
ncbi:unnamed protein product [Psylliodes chrysocephalus]|uniref:Uncharacterized protein n=1 Tax=Psylliodes chrysocephalus TaxID=3402493 RepID=A0A9P0G980_9CUCU|nr:unnamed protein product [Psylliodes chrysocephala]